MTPAIEDIDLKKMAADVRSIADGIENGTFIALAIVACEQDGSAAQACMVDSSKASHELLDEMVYEIKRSLFESYEG